MKGKGLKKKRGGGRGGRKESFYFKGTTTVKTKRERNWYYVRFLSPQSPGRQTGVRYSTSHGSHSASWACGAEHGAACGPATADPASIVQQLVNPHNSLILQSTQGTFATNTWKQPPWTSPVPVVSAPAPPGPAPCITKAPPKLWDSRSENWKILFSNDFFPFSLVLSCEVSIS